MSELLAVFTPLLGAGCLAWLVLRPKMMTLAEFCEAARPENYDNGGRKKIERDLGISCAEEINEINKEWRHGMERVEEILSADRSE